LSESRRGRSTVARQVTAGRGGERSEDGNMLEGDLSEAAPTPGSYLPGYLMSSLRTSNTLGLG